MHTSPNTPDKSEITSAECGRIFEAIIGRKPESDAVVKTLVEMGPRHTILKFLTESDEYVARARRVAPPFYTSSFDPIELMLRYEDRERKPVEGHVVNFFGVALRPEFAAGMPGIAGSVHGAPIPANWHADVAEFGAVLRAIELASSRFVVCELGCGWGCWLNIAGVVAKNSGKTVHVIGVEGDEGHIDFARQTLETNGFPEADITLVRGIAASTDGMAYFPKQLQSGVSWGLAPIFDGLPDKAAAENYDNIPMISLENLFADIEQVDLLHIDIQGGEATLIPQSIDILTKKVKYIVVGTHSREIDGLIAGVLERAGWALEMEKPTLIELSGGKPIVRIDGVQGWRNSHLV